MSGGVDSSATAALLLEQGYEVVGITLKLWPQDCVNRAEDKCCGPQAVTDARAVCHKLDIPYYLVDEAADFQKQVIQYFADEYKAGRTPNPCVMCNQNLKFGRLIDRADQLGAQFIATGHFARVETRAGRRDAYLLKRGRDLRKDQSYFLFSLRQTSWRARCFRSAKRPRATRARWPGIASSRPPTRRRAWKFASCRTTITAGFSRQANLAQKHRGEIADFHGQVLGHHDGIEFYTIGQRRGLGIPAQAVYVVELDVENNRVVVGDESALDRDEFVADDCNWHSV